MRPVSVVVVALFAAVLSTPAQAAFPGANGEIAFEDGSGSLSTVLPDGSTRPLPVNAPGPLSDPAYSADGAQLAFTNPDGLWVANADGSTPTQVAANTLGDARAPAWEPNGERLVFVREDTYNGTCVTDRVAIVNVTPPREEHLLTGNLGCVNPEPSWSPDGLRIAYVANGTRTDVWIVPAPTPLGPDLPPPAGPVGTNVTRSTDADNGAPDWSPDGQMLVFTRTPSEQPSSIYVMNADGSGARPVPAGIPANPAWSPDGTLIAYDDGEFIAFATLTPPSPADPQPPTAGTRPAWRPTDSVPPAITLAVPPDGAQYEEGGTVASDYSCSDAPPPSGSGVVLACNGPAPSGAPIDMSVGEHSFTVTARDRMGNPSAVTHLYTVTARPPPPPPRTNILTGPRRRTRATTARFTFAADTAPVSFTCKLDGGAWRRCSGDHSDMVRRLPVGVHIFRVRASGAGGIDPAPPSWRWRVVPRRLKTTIFSTFERHLLPDEFVVFRSVVARHVPAGARIHATCRGRGCPRGHDHSWATRRARVSVDLASWLRGLKLQPRARLVITVSKPGYRKTAKLYCIRHQRRLRIVGFLGGRWPACR
jgi:hypothetical protein